MTKFIDSHADTASKMYQTSQHLQSNNLCIDINKLKKSGSQAQFFAMYINQEKVKSSFIHCNELLDNFKKELSINGNDIALCRSYDDMINLENKIGAFLTIEEGDALEGKIENIKYFKEKGISLITLLWNYENDLGFPNIDFKYANKGLKKTGFEAVEEMNNLNMLIDVSHLSDQGFYDVIQSSNKPIVASHSNSREMTNHSRNLDDEMIKTLAKNGGIMGLAYSYDFLKDNQDISDLATIKNMIRHLKHVKNVGGIDVLALGSDYDGLKNPIEMKDISEMYKLEDELKKENFTSIEIDKIFYKNTSRIIKEVLK